VSKRHHGKRKANVSARISAALSQFLHIVDSEATKIKASSGSSSQAQQSLQSILKAAQEALANVKNCESAPAPSGAYHTPASSVSVLATSVEIHLSLKLTLYFTDTVAMSSAFGHNSMPQEYPLELTVYDECFSNSWELWRYVAGLGHTL
jgi:hypothetical protein